MADEVYTCDTQTTREGRQCEDRNMKLGDRSKQHGKRRETQTALRQNVLTDGSKRTLRVHDVNNLHNHMA